VLCELDAQDLAKTLKGTAESIKEKIFNNMSERAAQMLKEDIEYMGPVPVSDIRKSREKIVNIELLAVFRPTGCKTAFSKVALSKLKF
jgi:flagellar motor switch protein FliG